MRRVEWVRGVDATKLGTRPSLPHPARRIRVRSFVANTTSAGPASVALRWPPTPCAASAPATLRIARARDLPRGQPADRAEPDPGRSSRSPGRTWPSLMGMRRGGVSRLIDELLEAGLVFEGAKGESPRRRKPARLSLRRDAGAAAWRRSTSSAQPHRPRGRRRARPSSPGSTLECPTRPRPQQLVKDVANAVARVLESRPEFGGVHWRRGLRHLGPGRLRRGGSVSPPALGWRRGRAPRAAEGRDAAAGRGRELER